MFDRLGDMLNECLEMGRIPPSRQKRTFYKAAVSPAERERAFEAESIALPHDIEEALILLGLIPTEENAGILGLPALSQVRACYARLLKEAHPDTAQDEVDSPQAAQQIAQLTSAFNKVREWYGKLEGKG